MKIYRFEHKKYKTGMFSSNLFGTEYEALQELISRTLMDHYDVYPDDLKSPKVEFIEILNSQDKNIDTNDWLQLSKNNEYQNFINYIHSGGIFGCSDLEKTSKWILNDSNLLDNMLKCGYFLYEIELKEDSNIYKLNTQVVFKRHNIVKTKVLHAKTILKEFLK